MCFWHVYGMVLHRNKINIVALILYTKSHVASLLYVSAVCDQQRVAGVGNCLFLHAQGWGIDRPVRKKKSPRVCPGREMLTGEIEHIN